MNRLTLEAKEALQGAPAFPIAGHIGWGVIHKLGSHPLCLILRIWLWGQP